MYTYENAVVVRGCEAGSENVCRILQRGTITQLFGIYQSGRQAEREGAIFAERDWKLNEARERRRATRQSRMEAGKVTEVI